MEDTEEGRMDDDELGTLLIGCAIQVHRVLGPGLLESVYETCLLHELGKTGFEVKKASRRSDCVRRHSIR